MWTKLFKFFLSKGDMALYTTFVFKYNVQLSFLSFLIKYCLKKLNLLYDLACFLALFHCLWLMLVEVFFVRSQNLKKKNH